LCRRALFLYLKGLKRKDGLVESFKTRLGKSLALGGECWGGNVLTSLPLAPRMEWELDASRISVWEKGSSVPGRARRKGGVGFRPVSENTWEMAPFRRKKDLRKKETAALGVFPPWGSFSDFKKKLGVAISAVRITKSSEEGDSQNSSGGE